MDETSWEKCIIAYEPIWAHKTGLIASVDQIQEELEYIRYWLLKNCGHEVAMNMRILYGGAITDKVTEKIIRLKDVDGFLVGLTSCKPVFRQIFEKIHKMA